MSEFPTPHTIGLHVWSGTGEDDHGNEIDVYTPPLDEAGAAHAVIGWSVPSSEMPAVAGHDRVVVDVELLVPPGFPAKARDVIDLPYGPAGQFAVVGEIRGTEGNPFGWAPGGVVNLERVDG
ncbi:hypothetical protein NONO_c73460 [Nocardia nova SH22a]|uniref:Head-to-tail stopper n=1 Tax=Nocardia nova SH22a TaxID=1415166 RepID=W5TS44_9NOCA|nr:hypothetical protein [Nocardia nova]AHH22102.1 hypothetical protein NONO_c73460 [Nocardia nova SH22a]